MLRALIRLLKCATIRPLLGRGRIVAGRFRLCVCVHVCTCVANHALVDLVKVMIGDFVFREFDIEYLFC